MKRNRKNNESFNRIFVPKKRREYIDYDYVSKLSPEDQQWLAKFSDEYYGADFDINDTYIKDEEGFVQVKGNKNKKDDLDLRKIRRVTKYYLDENGDFTNDTQYKYSSSNIHNTEELRTKCNKNVESLGRDLMSMAYKNENKTVTMGYNDSSDHNVKYGDHVIEDLGLAGNNLSVENEILLQEQIKIEVYCRTKDEIDEVVNVNYKKQRKKRQVKNLGK